MMKGCSGNSHSGSDRPEIVAIIPARGGSKGILRKNLVPLAGKPLIAHTLQVALHSQMINRVVVSTDDEEIAEVAIGLGAEVPFLRPKHLANDYSSLNDVINHSITRLEQLGYCCDVVAIMLPSHPFRSVHLVDSLLGVLLEGCTMVLTVRKKEVSATNFFGMSKDGRLTCLFTQPAQHGVYYRNYGLFTAYNRTGQPPMRGIHLYQLCDPISVIDIDTHDDLALAEVVFQKKLFDFGLQ